MKNAKVMIPVVSLLVLLMAAGAYAYGGMGRGTGGGGLAAVWKQLSPEQQKQIEALRFDLIKKHEDLRSQIAKKRIEMMELASKDKPDEQAIDQKRQEIWALKDAERNDFRAFGTKVRSLLTPEQKKEIGPFGLGFGGGRGMGGGGGCGMGMGRGGCCGMGGGPGFGSGTGKGFGS